MEEEEEEGYMMQDEIEGLNTLSRRPQYSPKTKIFERQKE